MPHLSKRKLDKKVLIEVYNKFLINVLQRGRIKSRINVFAELLTETEKIMLAKRFTLVCMLGEGYTFDDIQKKLCLSPSTISRFWGAIRVGKYQEIVNLAKRSRGGKRTSETFLDFIFGKIPSIHGPRWLWMDDLYR